MFREATLVRTLLHKSAVEAGGERGGANSERGGANSERGRVRALTLYQTRALSQPRLGNHQRATRCLIQGNYTLPVNYKFITADGFEHFKYPNSKYRNPVNPKIVTTVLFKLVLETSHLKLLY